MTSVFISWYLCHNILLKKIVPYIRFGMKQIKRAELFRSRLVEFDPRSYFGKKIGSSSFPRNKNEGQTPRCG